jgi:hypothetical protein
VPLLDKRRLELDRTRNACGVRQAVPPRQSSRHRGPNQHVEKLAGPEAKRLAGQTEDTRPAGTNNFDFSPTAQADFFDSLDLLGPADDFDNLGNLAGLQVIEGDQLVHGMA